MEPYCVQAELRCKDGIRQLVRLSKARQMLTKSSVNSSRLVSPLLVLRLLLLLLLLFPRCVEEKLLKSKKRIKLVVAVRKAMSLICIVPYYARFRDEKSVKWKYMSFCSSLIIFARTRLEYVEKI